MFELLHHTQDVGTAAQPVDVNTAILLALAFGTVPVFIGLSNSMLPAKYERSKPLMASVALGITIFSVWDLFQGASGLGLNLGSESAYIQMLLILASAIGFFVPFVAGRKSKSSGTYTVAYLFAMIVGFHAFAEGIIIGFDLQSEYAFTFTQRSVQALSFILHKLAEGFIISIPIMLRYKGEVFVISGIMASVPLLAGIAFAYIGIPSALSSYAFALGMGGSVYILLRLAQLVHKISSKIVIGAIIGIAFMYLAGWIHTLSV